MDHDGAVGNFSGGRGPVDKAGQKIYLETHMIVPVAEVPPPHSLVPHSLVPHSPVIVLPTSTRLVQ